MVERQAAIAQASVEHARQLKQQAESHAAELASVLAEARATALSMARVEAEAEVAGNKVEQLERIRSLEAERATLTARVAELTEAAAHSPLVVAMASEQPVAEAPIIGALMAEGAAEKKAEEDAVAAAAAEAAAEAAAAAEQASAATKAAAEAAALIASAQASAMAAREAEEAAISALGAKAEAQAAAAVKVAEEAQQAAETAQLQQQQQLTKPAPLAPLVPPLAPPAPPLAASSAGGSASNMLSPTAGATVGEIFRMFDSTGNGVLEPEEVRAAFTHLAQVMPEVYDLSTPRRPCLSRQRWRRAARHTRCISLLRLPALIFTLLNSCMRRSHSTRCQSTT